MIMGYEAPPVNRASVDRAAGALLQRGGLFPAGDADLGQQTFGDGEGQADQLGLSRRIVQVQAVDEAVFQAVDSLSGPVPFQRRKSKTQVS